MRIKVKSRFYQSSGTVSSHSRYRRLRSRTQAIQKTYGVDRKLWKHEEEAPAYEEGGTYTNRQLELMADEWLRQDARSEICRECKGRGDATGAVRSEGQSVTDGEGNELFIEFPEYVCKNGHTWFQGEGDARGIGGDNPILFEEHLQSRRRREIFPTSGTPDPSIVAGIYNRVHPQGRKVNSAEQRTKNGASFYR